MRADANPPVAVACPGCGAPVPMPTFRLSAVCAHCDTPVVDAARARATVDAVVPFQVPRKAAAAAIAAHLRAHRLAPRRIARLRVLDRHLEGEFMPVYAIDGTVTGRYEAKIGIHYTTTTTRRGLDGKRRTVTEVKTQWFSLRGRCGRNIEDHLASGAAILPEQVANALEPFDLGWAQAFDPRLVAGFAAYAFDTPRDQAVDVAHDEILAAEARRIARDFLPGDEKDLASLTSNLRIERVRRVLVPIWRAKVPYAGRQLVFTVNGQTGRVLGKVPVSPWKVGGIVAAVAAVLLYLWWRAGG